MSQYLRLMYRRAFVARDPALVQIAFEAAVLDRYRETPGFSIVRTDSAGRVKKEGGWTLDFGIALGDESIHASWRDIETRLPDSEREHWADHVPATAVSENFVRMQLAPGGCFDDGDVRRW